MHKLENESSDWSERGNKTSTVHFLIKTIQIMATNGGNVNVTRENNLVHYET